MVQKIGENIQVLGIYKRASFTPKRFSWGNRPYDIEEVTTTFDTKDGGVKKRFYSVVSGGNLYKLCFDREREVWSLEEVWMEE